MVHGIGDERDGARPGVDGLPGGGLNIAHEAADRHVARGRGDRVALRCPGRDGTVRTVSYAELSGLSGRFAGLLHRLGVERGERVFTLLGRVPDLYTAALGTLKAGCVLSPLFSAFGPEPVRTRLAAGDGRVLVTTRALYRRKVACLRGSLPGLRHVLLVDGAADGDEGPGTVALHPALAAADPDTPCAPTGPEDMALLHFTSGTTGRPKGAVHVHGAVVGHLATARHALGLGADDVFWCTADPGWVTGTSYGIVAPLAAGATVLVDDGEFDAERWYAILRDHRVAVWYTAPTAIRMLMKAGAAVARRYDRPALRVIASVGEPLNAEAVTWAQDTLGLPVRDTWWQTETGAIMIACAVDAPVRPGSMGRPEPGIEAAIVTRTPGGGVRVADGPGTVGEIALRAGWPSMFRGYLGDEERYRRCFADGWYLSGDLGVRDADGCFRFVGRADDVIKAAGHLIGPFEVESVLMEHEAVAEAGVIGVPDPIAGETVKAFVTLKAGHTPSEALARALIGHARARLGPAVAPRALEFRDALPHTRSGKIMRRLLKARELGLPEGDLSTLEGNGDGRR
ncbi:acetate--CoA ligase [Azospirillum halopraeferens]|uniref:acetate--CoA ligase n=1 Tax=Azospirillum halopraeferens TaxID=34010 RepID=UPI000402EE5F|nr:acetate--CoA ligase [Azospirillum halopraeferens]